MSSLPALPALRRLDWMGNKRVGVGPLRHLLDRAPRLQVEGGAGERSLVAMPGL
jgi:hypothetical protein